MSWIAFLLGLMLATAGGAALVLSIDLLTTELGLLYATCGAVAFSGGIIVIAIGLLIRRVDALRRALPPANEWRLSERSEPLVPPLVAASSRWFLASPAQCLRAMGRPRTFPNRRRAQGPLRPFDAGDPAEAPINENRKGHLPSLEAPEGRRRGAGAAADVGWPLQRGRRQLFDLLRWFDRGFDGSGRFQIWLDERVQSLHRR